VVSCYRCLDFTYSPTYFETLECSMLIHVGLSFCAKVEPTGKPGYVKLLLAQNTDAQETNQLIQMAVGKNNLLSAEKLANRFMGELKRCLQQCQQDAWNQDNLLLADDDDDARWKLEQLRHIDDRTKLRRHGPAIQMDVSHLPLTPTKLFYSVDMVPTIQISGGNGEDHYYVAKPIKRASGPQIAWRRSFSLQEKDRLTTLDQDQGCRKQVLRVLKVIRNREPGLKLLTSYHLKTVLFRKTDELSDPAQWRNECLGQRLMDVIAQIEKEMGRGTMPNYFLPDVNLLDGMKEKAVFNMRQRLKHLKNSERKMTKLLQSKAKGTDTVLSVSN